MPQVNQFLTDLSKHSDAVKKCARPLNRLGITCFYYVSIKANGDHILLTDCPHVDEYYYQEKIYYKDPYLRHPDNYKSGFFLFEANQKEQFDESLIYLSQTFGISPLIGLCEKLENEVELFGFWGNSDVSHGFEDIYLNYANLLKIFAAHFKQECASIIKTGISPYLDLNELLGPELFARKVVPQDKVDAQALRKYMIEIGLRREVEMAETLSLREKECLKLLVHGKSSKETALELNLSPRTIEHYLDNIKNKFNCRYKNDLFVVSEKLTKLELI